MRSILLWNVNGLRAINKKTVSSGYSFEEFIYKEDADIVCLNETKISNTYEMFLSEYKYQIHSISKHKKGYSGVSVFSKIRHEKQHHEFEDNEGRVICLEYSDFILINVYVPNASTDLKRNNFKHEWMNKFMNNIKNLNSNKMIIIAGDFNCALDEIDVYEPEKKHHSPGFSDMERADHKKLLELGYLDPFRAKYPNRKAYTYYNKRINAYRRNIGWYIDKILVSEKDIDRLIDYTIIDEYGVSDHVPIKMKFE